MKIDLLSNFNVRATANVTYETNLDTVLYQISNYEITLQQSYFFPLMCLNNLLLPTFEVYKLCG